MNHGFFNRPEPLTIRPPSEWKSLLLRSTRGCNWNHCRFCGVYPALGQAEFSIRPVDEVLSDIDWYTKNMPDLTSAFIGDADPLIREVDESLTIISALRERLPGLSRITTYARASTLYKLGGDTVAQFADAGLTRVHVGLESGDLQTLKFHRKGQTPKLVEEVAQRLRSAGIELSCYVLLGLGGKDRWREHVDGTAELINRVNPDFIRLRRIWLFSPGESSTQVACPLAEDIKAGTFVPQSPEGTVHELRRLVERIGEVSTEIVSDHANNYVNVKGVFPADRGRMLAEIDAFLALPSQEREQHYKAVGSRI